MRNIKHKEKPNGLHCRLFSISLALSIGLTLIDFGTIGDSIGCTKASAADVAPAKPPKIEVRLLSGAVLQGELLNCQDGEISIAMEKSGEKKIPTADVAMLVFSDVSATTTTAGQDILKLSDGSSVHCRSMEGKDNEWVIESASGVTFTATPAMLSVLQFRDISNALREAIEKGLTAIPVTDEMLIKRPGDTIDKIQGVIMGLDANAATFSFDGQTIPAPRAKLAGLVWAQPNEVVFKPTIRVRTRDGSKWEATELSYLQTEIGLQSEGGAASTVQWKLRCGADCHCDPSEVVSVDYSNAIVRWLAAIPALETKSRENPFLAIPLEGRKDLLSPYFSSRTNGVDDSDEPSVKNLIFPVDGEFATRVPEGTSRFRTKIVRPDEAKIQGKIRCEVWSNDLRVWSSQDASQESPWTVDVTVTSEKRLRLVVESDAGVSIGSMVTWVQPRFSP